MRTVLRVPKGHSNTHVVMIGRDNRFGSTATLCGVRFAVVVREFATPDYAASQGFPMCEECVTRYAEKSFHQSESSDPTAVQLDLG